MRFVCRGKNWLGALKLVREGLCKGGEAVVRLVGLSEGQVGCTWLVLAFRVDNREGFQGRVSSRKGGLVWWWPNGLGAATAIGAGGH